MTDKERLEAVRRWLKRNKRHVVNPTALDELHALLHGEERKESDRSADQSRMCCTGPGMSPWPCPVCGEGGR